MSEKAGKLRGRRGAVLLCAGALLGAVIAGPGATIAQKLTSTTTKTKFIRTGTILTVGKTETTKIDKFSSTTFTPIAQTTIKAPGPGRLEIVGDVSAKDDGVAAGGGRLQYRLRAGTTPLTTAPEAFELFLPVLTMPSDDGRENGSVNGVVKVARKGNVPIALEAQKVGTGANNSDVQILGRSVSAVFIPKGKAPAKKKTTGKSPTGKTPVGP